MRTLHIVVRDPDGRMGDQAIGQAIVAAAIDEKVTKSALRKSLLALAFYQAHSPRQAAEAMRTLAELGDVDFEESDFDPEWFQPAECIAAIDVLLEHGGRRLSRAVHAELVRLRQALTEAGGRGCSFYLVELEPEERLAFAQVRLAE